MRLRGVGLRVAGGGGRLEGGVDFPVGLNLYFPGEILHGHRRGIEVSLPVHQDLDGPQLRQDWSLSIGWEKVY
jgi:hypothetical protein